MPTPRDRLFALPEACELRKILLKVCGGDTVASQVLLERFRRYAGQNVSSMQILDNIMIVALEACVLHNSSLVVTLCQPLVREVLAEVCHDPEILADFDQWHRSHFS